MSDEDLPEIGDLPEKMKPLNKSKIKLIRTVMIREGLKLACEENLLQLQDYIIELTKRHEDSRYRTKKNYKKQIKEMADEKENLAESYLKECERNSMLRHKVEQMELEREQRESEVKSLKEQIKIEQGKKEREIDALKEQLEHKSKQEEIMGIEMTQLQLEKEEWKNKALKRKQTITNFKEENLALKSEVRQLCCEKESMQFTIERMESETKRRRRSSRLLNTFEAGDSEASMERVISPDITRRRSTLPLIGEGSNLINKTSSRILKHPNSLPSINPSPPSSLPSIIPSPPKSSSSTSKRGRRRSSHRHKLMDVSSHGDISNHGDVGNTSRDDLGKDRCL